VSAGGGKGATGGSILSGGDGGDGRIRFEDSDGVVENLAMVTPPPALGELGGDTPAEPEPATPAGMQRPGDFTQDGALNVSDVQAMLRFLFRNTGSAAAPCEGGGEDGSRRLLDADGDGQLTIADAVRLLGHLFQGGLPHVLGTDCVEIEGCPDVCRP
jgi:hypothetical protein